MIVPSVSAYVPVLDRVCIARAENIGGHSAQPSVRIAHVRHAAANGRTVEPPDDSDSAESAGASADEQLDHAADDADADVEASDSAESAGPSGDDEPGAETQPVFAGRRRSNSHANPEVGQTSSGRKRKRRVDSAGDAAGEDGRRMDEDDTAFSDGEEAPLMSPEGVAAATAGLEEPSSEDDDEADEVDGGAQGKRAWAGMLGEAGDSGDDSDAEDDGERLCWAAPPS